MDIPASADTVWQLIGSFDAWLAAVHPEKRRFRGGRVRTLTTADGTVIERLEAFDRQARLQLSIMQAPFPVVNYLSTCRCTPTALTWRAWNGRAASRSTSATTEAIALFSGIYQGDWMR